MYIAVFCHRVQSDIGQCLSYGVKTLAIVFPGPMGGRGVGFRCLYTMFVCFYRSIVS